MVWCGICHNAVMAAAATAATTTIITSIITAARFYTGLVFTNYSISICVLPVSGWFLGFDSWGCRAQVGGSGHAWECLTEGSFEWLVYRAYGGYQERKPGVLYKSWGINPLRGVENSLYPHWGWWQMSLSSHQRNSYQRLTTRNVEQPTWCKPGARFTDSVLRFYHMIYTMTKLMMC